MAGYDPRALRRNPEFNEILRVMRRTWSDLRAAKSYNEIRGHAAVLQAHIETLLDEPEHVCDLASGPATLRPMNLPEAGDQGPRYLDEGPFDQPGPDRGRFFYYTYNGEVTKLFKEPGDGYYPMRLSGYWVWMLEKRYAGRLETRNHLASDSAFERIRPRIKTPPPEAKGQWVILMDPRGIYDGRAARRAGLTTDYRRAVRTADRLTEWLEIRFVVAALAAKIHTH
ncbi:MAG: hypothetical protein KKB20_22240 [Proteobacteria bacterium]|nr:hypothetical protein [Pseudomonadota bacterium]